MKNFIIFPENFNISPDTPLTAACGVFDGVHAGHRRIIETAAARARAVGSKVLALSFSPHPRTLLTPGTAPALLISEEKRFELLHRAGADFCALINFTLEVAALSPEEFLNALQDTPEVTISGICVGSCWRFGCRGAGNRQTLAGFCAKNNWTLDAVPEVEMDGEVISSSAIRRAIAAGDLKLAAGMLGYEVTLSGKVVRGFQIAGSKLAAPTANLEVAYGILPPDGVYSGQVSLENRNYPAALNIGTAPTFGNDQHRVEIHLIGFSGDLYDRELTVTLHRFLRKEQRFSSPEALKEQICRDIAAIKTDFIPQ